ncbi:MAG: hypothetical protein IPL70_12460 [Uliginosibacterium sp.]|nr:hypothetical protein [Uliginosibacterium sp.]
MPDYLRALRPGAKFFITVNLLQRQGDDLLTCHIDLIRHVVRNVEAAPSLSSSRMGGLPASSLGVKLPPDEADFALRWRLIKMNFSKAIPLTERRNALTRLGGRADWTTGHWARSIGFAVR